MIKLYIHSRLHPNNGQNLCYTADSSLPADGRRTITNQSLSHFSHHISVTAIIMRGTKPGM